MIKKIINGIFSLNANSLGKLYDKERGQENRRARKHSLFLSFSQKFCREAAAKRRAWSLSPKLHPSCARKGAQSFQVSSMTEKNGFPSSGSRELRVADTLSHCIPRKLLLVHKGIRLVAPGLIDRTGGRREHWKK